MHIIKKERVSNRAQLVMKIMKSTQASSQSKALTLSIPINTNQRFSITSRGDLIKDELNSVTLYRVYWKLDTACLLFIL